MPSDQDRINLYRQMLRLRVFDKLTERYTMANKFVGSIHIALGQEAVAVGTCSVLIPGDFIAITYRGRGQALARGVLPERIWAEMMGRALGTSRGKGGPMHIGDPAHGVLTANAIVGAGIPIAAGAALAMRNEGTGGAVVAFFGEGATNQGVFTETLNMAALMRLPIIFMCESNQYAEMTPFAESSASANLTSRAAPFGVPAHQIDGNDVEEVATVVTEALNRARDGQGPTFIDAQTYRLSGHMIGDPNTYRSKDEIAEMWETEPLKRYERELAASGILDEPHAARLLLEVTEELEQAWLVAESAPLAPPSDAFEDVYATAGFGGL